MQRTIKTNLAKKESLFNVLALAESIGLPVLLIGDPGVAKTAAVMDYAKTAKGGTLGNNDVFLLETDEGTRSNAIKGNIDLEALTTTNKYQVVSPIADAEFVIINEIDKASASLRNSLLGVMNEKVLFNGQEKRDCNWNTFIATCNSIPEEEKDSPFWDRFAITFTVDRLRETEMLEYFTNGGRNSITNYNVRVASKDEIQANLSTIDIKYVKKAMDVCYGSLSDRTLSYLPTLVAAIMTVYGLNQARAFIKAVELIVGKSESNILAKSIMSKELRALYDKIDMIGACTDINQYTSLMTEINALGGQLSKSGKMSKDDLPDALARAKEEQNKLSFLSDEKEEEVVANAMA